MSKVSALDNEAKLSHNTVYLMYLCAIGNPYNRSTDGKLIQWQGLVDARGAGALVLLFLLVMLVFLGFSWYMGYRSVVELFAN
jgi:multisubunit Na+/H+ antiporter MnhB subunit